MKTFIINTLFLLSIFNLGLYAEIIPNNYIVVFKNDSSNLQSKSITVEQQVHTLMSKLQQTKQNQKISSTSNNAVQNIYKSSIKGFSVELSDEDVSILEEDASVDYIQPDTMVYLDAVQTPTESWGLDRVDSHVLPLDDSYHYTRTGQGVHAYIIDTGINANHEEFQGRVGEGYDFVEEDSIPNDEQGHGSHVAGTIGGTNYGIAKNVTLHALRVFGATGRARRSDIIAAIDWVTEHHIAPAVINMSLGGKGADRAEAEAIKAATDKGVVVVVSAGNDTDDACNYTPASNSDAITVAASNDNDGFAYFSNYGECVDIIAPGVNIVSVNYVFNFGSTSKSGTSMAAPHVVGAVALYFEAHPQASALEVKRALIAQASQNKVSETPAQTPNKLLYTLEGDNGGTPPPSTGKTWTTGRYSSNADISKELNIEGATSLTVSIQGEVENGYDYILITDGQGQEQRFTGQLSEHFIVQGSSIIARLISDGSIVKEGVTVEIGQNGTGDGGSDQDTWNTGHYENNADITKELSIAGATTLTVTLEGEVEADYDYIIISDEAGKEHRFTGELHESFSVQGSSIQARLISDNSVRMDGVTVHIVSNNGDGGTNEDTWTTGRYENNVDITKVLRIAGATELILTIQGEVEENYDYLIITSEQGTERRFTGTIDGRFRVQGSSLTVRLTSDGSINKSGVTVHIEKSQ